MSDIKPGDLVMMVRPMPCCGDSEGMGVPFRVSEIAMSRGEPCTGCGDQTQTLCAIEPRGDHYYGYPLSILIKIDPPAQPERVETREVLHA